MILSGICLFVGLTEALPQKVSILGLDLSAKPHIAGWFLFFVTSYFFVTAVVFGVLDLIKHYLPSLIMSKSSNLTGTIIGLSEAECLTHSQSGDFDPSEIGTPFGEYKDIQRQKAEIEARYNSWFKKLSNFIKISVEFAFSLIFGFVSMVTLLIFLIAGCP
ncbi:hypothetical protein DWB84_07325 [Saccharophagus sp. K07]|uniref:hypothetical protein n=1 Tax=Saccharophagus sp. K07 TaxID=2283636 RepID=UPI001651FDBF|nr:hypothetical protein [Saccharophagus sp. K07]MBC6905271.1 hypothetical protein [Saccharophagus sp. K07]